MYLDDFYHFHFLENKLPIFENLENNKKLFSIFSFLHIDNFKII